MSSNRFEGVPRGRALSGSKAISEYMFNTPTKAETVVGLDRAEFGFVMIGRELVGYTCWIDHALAARANVGKSGRRHTRATAVTDRAEAAAAQTTTQP